MSSRSVQWLRSVASSIREDTADFILPPQEGLSTAGQLVLARSFTARTKPYIERIADQINATYENGCYDACAVLIRRLVETLIIECHEAKGISDRIKDRDGNFLMLRDLANAVVNEASWNIGRNSKVGLKKLKDKGDLSAHNRRYLAHRTDIDDIKEPLRVVVQELILLAGIQRAK